MDVQCTYLGSSWSTVRHILFGYPLHPQHPLHPLHPLISTRSSLHPQDSIWFPSWRIGFLNVTLDYNFIIRVWVFDTLTILFPDMPRWSFHSLSSWINTQKCMVRHLLWETFPSLPSIYSWWMDIWMHGWCIKSKVLTGRGDVDG